MLFASMIKLIHSCVSGVLFGWGQGKYYVKAPKEAANVGGVGFMS